MNNKQEDTSTGKIEVNSDLVSGNVCGVKYHVLPCARPSSTIELRLIVKVGSLMENDDERGFAHFIEHLGFKGTEKYGKYDLVKTLENLGVSYGPDLNASTSFLETKFRLTFQYDPSTFNERLELGLDILFQWATSMSISETDVDEEKSVVLAEYRGKQGLAQRLVEQYWVQVFGEDSYYSQRFPIGVPEIFMNASRQQLCDFYKRWYRPENMAILVIGDVGERIDLVERALHQGCLQFSSTSQETHQEPLLPPLQDRKLTPVWHQRDTVMLLTDPELTSSSVMIEFLQPMPTSRTKKIIEHDVMLRLMTSIVDKRLLHISKGLNVDGAVDEESAPFISAGISIRQLVRGLSCIGISATLSKKRLIELSPSAPSPSIPSSPIETQATTTAATPVPEATPSNIGPTVPRPSAAMSVDRRATKAAVAALLLEMRRMAELGIFPEELEMAKERWRRVFEERANGECLVDAASMASELEEFTLSGGETVFAGTKVEAALSIACLSEVNVASMNAFLRQLDMHEDAESSRHFYPKNPKQPLEGLRREEDPLGGGGIPSSEEDPCGSSASPLSGRFRVLCVQCPGPKMATSSSSSRGGSRNHSADGTDEAAPSMEQRDTSETEVPFDLDELLSEVREEVRSAGELRQWTPISLISPSDVIAAAQRVVENGPLEKGPQDLLSESPVLDLSGSVSSSGQTVPRGGSQGPPAHRPDATCGPGCGCNIASFLPPKMLAAVNARTGAGAGARDEESSSLGSLTNVNVMPSVASLVTAHLTDDSVLRVGVQQSTPHDEKTAVPEWIETPMMGIDATEIRLGNGVTVALKWMAEDSPNKISMQGFALGGSSELSEQEEVAFNLLDEASLESGFAQMESTDLLPESSSSSWSSSLRAHQLFSGREVAELQQRFKTRVNTQRHDHFRGLGGSCPTAQFELLLALLVLKLSTQYIDPDAMARIASRHAGQMEHRQNSPEVVFM